MNPELVTLEFIKNDGLRAEQLHLAKRALFQFADEHKGLPDLHSEADANALLDIASRILKQSKEHSESKDKSIDFGSQVESVDEEVVRKLALYCRAEHTAVASVLGGILAQEAMKKQNSPGRCKHPPLRQWLHFDAFELLKSEVSVNLYARASA